MMLSWRTSQKTDDRWYMGVECRHCHAPILFARDSGTDRGPMVQLNRLVLTCPEDECGHQDDYSRSPIVRLQKSADKPVASGGVGS